MNAALNSRFYQTRLKFDMTNNRNDKFPFIDLKINKNKHCIQKYIYKNEIFIMLRNYKLYYEIHITIINLANSSN